jgi:hypothetical protein
VSISGDEEVDDSRALFIHYPFAHACWALLNLQIEIYDNPFQVLESLEQLMLPFFMEVIILMSYSIFLLDQ